MCDPGWKGADCAVADLAPYRPDDGYVNHTAATWGGVPVQTKGELLSGERFADDPLLYTTLNRHVNKGTLT